MTGTRLPPELPAPALVQTLRFLKDPFSLMAEATERFGDVFTLRVLGFGTWVFVGSPELVRQVFRAPTDVLAAGEVNTRQLGFMLGTDATFTLDGEAHLTRSRIVHPLLNGRGALAHVAMIREVFERALASWPEGVPFSFLPHGHRLSLDVLMATMFPATPAERRRELAAIFDRFASRGLRSPLIALPALQIDLGPLSPWGRVLRLRREVRTALEQEVERYRTHAEEPGGAETEGVLPALIRARSRDGAALSASALLDEVINLLFAGHETTGTILSWVIECLCSRPPVLARVREELDQVLGDGPFTSEHAESVPYLEAVIQEAIRYRPIAPMAGVRLVKQPFALGEHVIPPGTLISQCFPAMTRRRDLFEEPESFRPEHFYQRKFKPFDWNPFGGGTRMCIGRGLAEIELKTAVATLVHHADLTIAQKRVTPTRHGFFFGPSEGLKVIVRRKTR